MNADLFVIVSSITVSTQIFIEYSNYNGGNFTQFNKYLLLLNTLVSTLLKVKHTAQACPIVNIKLSSYKTAFTYGSLSIMKVSKLVSEWYLQLENLAGFIFGSAMIFTVK